MFSKATLKQRLLKEFLRIIFSRCFLLFTSSLKKKNRKQLCHIFLPAFSGLFSMYWHRSWHNNSLRRLTGLWGKKTQRHLGEGMLGMLVQCTKDSYAVITVEALCVQSWLYTNIKSPYIQSSTKVCEMFWQITRKLWATKTWDLDKLFIF